MAAKIFWIYLFVINVAAFVVYMADKNKEHYGRRRIPAALLTTLYVAGGAYGAFMAMVLFKHLWTEKNFATGVPICLVLWLALIVVF